MASKLSCIGIHLNFFVITTLWNWTRPITVRQASNGIFICLHENQHQNEINILSKNCRHFGWDGKAYLCSFSILRYLLTLVFPVGHLYLCRLQRIQVGIVHSNNRQDHNEISAVLSNHLVDRLDMGIDFCLLTTRQQYKTMRRKAYNSNV